MNALPPAPDRAQRVRGIPGVGLRTADGAEWLRWGKGHRWPAENINGPTEAGWVIARCTHQTGDFVRLSEDSQAFDLGCEWDVCDGSKRARLNPCFVETLMGLPIGWTDPERSLTDYTSPVTGSSHNAQQKRYDNSSGGRRD